jgi:hypothetical protein
MRSHRINHIRIRLRRGTVEVPWESRNALFGQMLHLESAKPIIEAFEGTGGSRPIVFTHQQKGDLLEIIEFWATRDGVKHLPDGIFELRNALHDDLNDALQRDDA